MPGSGGRDFQVDVSVSSDESRAVVALGGDLDMNARPELTDAVHRLSAAAPDRVDVDVAAVRYVGSVLPDFLMEVRQAVPAASVITVSRPTFWTYFVLRATGMAEIVTIEDALSA